MSIWAEGVMYFVCKVSHDRASGGAGMSCGWQPISSVSCCCVVAMVLIALFPWYPGQQIHGVLIRRSKKGEVCMVVVFIDDSFLRLYSRMLRAKDGKKDL